MKLNLIFLSVVLVLQYEWLGVVRGCETIDTLEAFKAKTMGGKAAVLLLKCGTDAADVAMEQKTQKEMEEQCSKHNIPCYENDFKDDHTPPTFKPLDFKVCPSFFLFKDGTEVKRVSDFLNPKTYEHIDSLCATKV